MVMSRPFVPAVTQALKSFAGPAFALARELPLRADLARLKGERPLAVFLPCEGRTGAALLRIYAVAEGLRPLGWRCLVVPPKMTLSQRQRFLTQADPDVLVMQGARHALNRPCFYAGAPIVYDMDDADFHLPHLIEPVRAAMHHVEAVAAGSRYIADWCRKAGAKGVEVVWTGAAPSARFRPPQEDRPPVIAWAQTRPQAHLREAELVREVTTRLAARRPGLTLRLYDRQKGDAPDFAARFNAPGLSVEWVKKAIYSDYLSLFDDVSLGLAPLCPEDPFSRGKSFGKVLAYFDREVPVLASEAGEHGAFFRPGLGVLSNDPQVWVDEGVRLLDNGAARAGMAAAARFAFEVQLSQAAAAARMDRLLCRVVGKAQSLHA